MIWAIWYGDIYNLNLSGDCFLIDAAAANKVFVWKGKDANPEERKAAIENADKFIQQNVCKFNHEIGSKLINKMF